MKINSKFYRIMLLAIGCLMPLAMNCMRPRRNNQSRRPQPARQNPAPQPAAQEQDEDLQLAIALSLAQAPAPSGADENSPSSMEKKINEVGELPKILDDYTQHLDNAVGRLYQDQPAEMFENIGKLEQDGRHVLVSYRDYISPFLEAATVGSTDRCNQLYLEMLYFDGRLRTIKEVFQGMLRGLQSVEQPVASDFPIPAGIQVPGIMIRHLKTGGQTGATCGAHAVVNARAIQQILESHEQLTSGAIIAKAAPFMPNAQGQNLSSEEAYELAKKIGLNGVFIFGFNSTIQTFYEAGRPANFDSRASLEEIITIIKTSPAGDYYFVLNTGGHWVVVAIIKLIGQLPQVVYLDSGNGHLAEGNIGTQFIKYLLHNIFEVAV